MSDTGTGICATKSLPVGQITTCLTDIAQIGGLGQIVDILKIITLISYNTYQVRQYKLGHAHNDIRNDPLYRCGGVPIPLIL